MRKPKWFSVRRCPFVIPWINAGDVNALALDYNARHFPTVHSVEPNVFEMSDTPKGRKP
jgi:hypothetical protein